MVEVKNAATIPAPGLRGAGRSAVFAEEKKKREFQGIGEKIARYLFTLAGAISILCVALICFFLFAEGIPAVHKIGLKAFIFGKAWAPMDNPASYGIFPMICGSFLVTLGAAVAGIPAGLLTAVYLARFSNKRFYRFLKSATDLMAGIPSVVYGFFGLVILVPFVRLFRVWFGGNGCSILTASLVLGLMILPTIVSVSESAIRAVPDSYYMGSRALGATHERSVFRCILPAAKSGIMAGIILALGRAIGETMAVVMVAGNQARMPESIFDGVRTMTANIVIEMGYATGLHREALIATGMVLFIFILIINLIFNLVSRKSKA